MSRAKKQWIQDAGPLKKGALHSELGVPQGEKIPKDKLVAAERSTNPKLRHRAQFAINANK